jgi:hypothetical protein
MQWNVIRIAQIKWRGIRLLSIQTYWLLFKLKNAIIKGYLKLAALYLRMKLVCAQKLASRFKHQHHLYSGHALFKFFSCLQKKKNNI